MTGIALLSQIPLRKEPTHTSEMTSQLLFGETFSVEKQVDNWLKIKVKHDGYEGFLNVNQFEELQCDEIPDIPTKSLLTEIVDLQRNQKMLLSAGSLITSIHDNVFSIGSARYEVLHSTPVGFYDFHNITDVASMFLNIPYLWGGRTVMGMDCSGYSQLVYRLCGINIPRDASQQVECGSTLNFLQETMPGDLAFFGDDEKITHVGIMVDNSHVIHCSGCVRKDKIDNQGIFDGRKYTHTLRVIKRIIKL